MCAHVLVECPNAGCGAKVKRIDMVSHRMHICNWCERQCASPGCAEILYHDDSAMCGASEEVHMDRACRDKNGLQRTFDFARGLGAK